MNKRIVFIISIVLFISITSCTSTSGASVPTSASEVILDSTVDWDDAKSYIGEFKKVCGPVVDSHYASSSNGQPTFINVGKEYPDPDRFTVVIWGRYRGNFASSPEQYYLGKTICVNGLIEEYEGVSQIEANSPSQIEIK